jgi:predicted nucleic-acid-binding Zn-ribbon protein
MAKNQSNCTVCKGNNYVKKQGSYPSIIFLYKDSNNFINCPKCTSHLDSRKTTQETRITDNG